MNRRTVAGFEIRNTVTGVFARFLRQRLRARQTTLVFFANANFITRCRSLRHHMQSSEVYIVPDGIAMDAVSWILYGHRFRQNLNGTDFVPHFLETIAKGTRVYLVGGTPDAVRVASERFSRRDGITIVGKTDGYSLWGMEDEVLNNIAKSKADIVLVAMGNPLQEEWILRSARALPGVTLMGVGALFDFESGAKTRAPTFVRRLRLEWLFRLLLEPRRLLHRYTIGIGEFLIFALFSHFNQRTRGG